MNGMQRKEGTGKSMKNALYLLGFAKRHLRAKVKLNSEIIEHIALVIVELHVHWSEDIM